MQSDNPYNKNYLSGWNLTKTISLLLIANVILTLALLDIKNKETISILIRSTAKFSFVLFIMAFSASSYYYFFKNSITRWMLANRRYLGVAFAVSHYLHLFALLLMTFYISFNVFEDRGLFTTIGGAIGYVFITIMTITSFDRTKNLINPKNWKLVHTIGGYYLWIIFAKSYLPNLLNDPIAALFAIVAVTALLLKLLKNKKKGK